MDGLAVATTNILRIRSSVTDPMRLWFSPVLLVLLSALLLAAQPARANRVEIPGVGGVTLTAEYTPPPSGNINAPGMLLLHDCSGLWSKPGVMAARPARMAGLLQELGYGVLMVDSFGPRGVHEVCTTPSHDRPVNVQRRAEDAQRAINWLKARKEIDSSRIAVLGWSQGATTVLSLMNADNPGVRAAVAFYPSCAQFLKLSQRYQPAAPTLVLAGEADDWTPVEPCRDLVARSGMDTFRLVSYPDVFHDFDDPGVEVHVRKDIPNEQHPGQGVTVGYNQAATDDAYRRVFKWCSRWLDPFHTYPYEQRTSRAPTPTPVKRQ
jgi:dienelactone hydrolase